MIHHSTSNPKVVVCIIGNVRRANKTIEKCWNITNDPSRFALLPRRRNRRRPITNSIYLMESTTMIVIFATMEEI